MLGPSEDGYEAELDRLLARTTCQCLRGLLAGDVHDAYAASDLVVMPSTWEGFGNPVLESVTHDDHSPFLWYPSPSEIAAYGFDFLWAGEVAR